MLPTWPVLGAGPTAATNSTPALGWLRSRGSLVSSLCIVRLLYRLMQNVGRNFIVPQLPQMVHKGRRVHTLRKYVRDIVVRVGLVDLEMVGCHPILYPQVPRLYMSLFSEALPTSERLGRGTVKLDHQRKVYPHIEEIAL